MRRTPVAPDRDLISEVVDTLIFLIMALAQLGLLIYVTVRDRRARNRTRVTQGALA